MSAPLKKVLLIGAGGSLGGLLLARLRKEPSLTITLLQRSGSKTPLDPELRTIIVPDSYPHDALVEAFHGQDVVVNCMSMVTFPQQKALIDAAVASGTVRRWFASEYGLEMAHPAAQALSPLFAAKFQTRQYLQHLAAEGRMEWTSINPGLWLSWCFPRGFAGMKVREGRFVVWDDGDSPFTVSTEPHTATAVLRLLTSHADVGRNCDVLLSDAAPTQMEMIAVVERLLGRKMAIDHVDAAALVKEKQASYAAGDATAALPLAETGFMKGEAYGAYLEKEGEILNERLGLDKVTLDEIVAEALRASGLLDGNPPEGTGATAGSGWWTYK